MSQAPQPERPAQERQAAASRHASDPLLVVLSGPSGAGKTTVGARLLAGMPGLARAVTCTTRPPRPGEQSGVDYHFLGRADFERKVAAGEFLEHALVHGHHYGTLTTEVRDRLKAGRDVLLNVDVQGAASVRARAEKDAGLARSLVTVFLAPPTADVLEQRLRGRATDSDAVIRRRLAAARKEIACWRQFDYLVVSGTVAEDVRRMQQILEVERMRSKRVAAPAWVLGA
jgi:guanylate kinase